MTSARLLDGLPAPESAFYTGVPVKRGLAWVVDSLIVTLVSLIAVPFTAFTAVFYFPLLWLALNFGYRWFTLAGGSATWGMQLMSIEIRKADGDHLDSQTAMLHTLGYTVSILIAPLQLISIVMMLLTERGRGLTDTVLQTAAINKPA